MPRKTEPRTPEDSVLTVSVTEAGRMLGIGQRAAYRAAKEGRLPVLRFGRSIVVPLSALNEYVHKEALASTVPLVVKDDSSGF